MEFSYKFQISKCIRISPTLHKKSSHVDTLACHTNDIKPLCQPNKTREMTVTDVSSPSND